MVAERGAVLQCVGCKSVSSVEKESMAVVVDAQKGRNRMMMMTANSVNSWVRGSLIGQGAFGKVNLALNRESGELFAVKSIEWGGDEKSSMMNGEMKAMETEVGILESLKESPFVVNCLGSSISVEDGKTMRNLFMEYMPGGSVADLMKKFGGGGFEEPLLRKYTRGILEGIQFLHAEGIVHCDIKGRNVLVGSTGVVKLADFGGARRFLGLEEGGGGGGGGEEVVLTVEDSDLLNVKGTPLWMAPEVVRQKEQGPACDIWSLGCTVLEMATGKAPWSDIVGSDPFVALYHIGCTEEVPTVPARLSEQGRDFLSKCFQRDPRVRWTAAQLLQHPFITDAALAIQSNEPTAKLPESPTSTFDFPSSTSTSSTHNNTASAAALTTSTTIANSVPILRSPLHFFAKRFPLQQQQDPQQQQQQVCSFFRTEDPASPLTRTPSSIPSTPSTASPWCNSPLSDFGGQWITVRTPTKTVSSAPSLSSPIVPHAAAAAMSPAAAGAESAPVKVEEMVIAPVSSCGAPTEDEVVELQQLQNDESPEVETTSSRASSSSAIPHQSPSSSFNRSSEQNVDEVDTVLSSIQSNRNNSELGFGPSAPAAAAAVDDDDERRFVDPREMATPISGPSRATLRSFLQKEGPAHGKLSCKGRKKRRPKPRLKRFRGCKGLHGLLHRRQPWSRRRVCSDRFIRRSPPPFVTHQKLSTTLGRRKVHNYSFRELSVLSLRRISTDSFARALVRGAIILQSLFFRNRYGWKLQPFFKDRLFLNKRASPQWLLQSTQRMMTCA